MENLCVYENNYFLAVAYVYESSNYIIIYRRDTYEGYLSLSLIYSEKNEWSYCVKHIISRLAKPIDWKRPHRYCLARYARSVLKQDAFSESLRSHHLKPKNIFKYITLSRLKEAVLIKKLNQLTFEEKRQLFIIKDWEKNNFTAEDIHYALFGREYLYKRLYDKEKFSHYYQNFCQNFEELLKIGYNSDGFEEIETELIETELIDQNFKINNSYIYKNKYFVAVIDDEDKQGNEIETIISIRRRDTWERYTKIIVKGTDKNVWFLYAKKFIGGLAQPCDWKRPHRYSLARYYRYQLEQDAFLKALSSNQLAVREIFRYITISQLKETVLIKKLNHLTFEEKKQLFIIKDWEKDVFRVDNIHYLLSSRKYLYSRLHDKKRFYHYYLEFCQSFENLLYSYNLENNKG